MCLSQLSRLTLYQSSFSNREALLTRPVSGPSSAAARSISVAVSLSRLRSALSRATFTPAVAASAAVARASFSEEL